MKAKLIFVTLILATASMIFADDTKPGPFTDQDYHGYIITNAGKIFAGTGTFAVITADQTIYTASGTNIDMNGFLILNLADAATASGAVNFAQVQAMTGALHTAMVSYFVPLSGGTMSGDLIMGSVNFGNDISNVQVITFPIPAAGNVMEIRPTSAEYLVITNRATPGYIEVLVKTPTIANGAANKTYVDTADIGVFANVTNGFEMGEGKTILLDTNGSYLMGEYGNVTLLSYTKFTLNIDGTYPIGFYADGKIDMAGMMITNITTSTAANGVVTKAYVDTFLPLSGGTMSDDISMYGNKILNTAEVTGNAGGNLKIVAHTASGRNLDVMGNDGSNTIIAHVATPTAATDAANKAYVDTADIGVFANVTNGFEMGEGKTILLDTNGSYLMGEYGNVTLLSYTKFTLNIDGTYPIGFYADGKIDMAGMMITNITTSTELNGAVTKEYAQGYVDGATNQYSAVSWSVSTPNTGAVSAVTIQLKNSSGSNLSGYYMLDMWTSTNTYGLPVDYSDTNVYSVGTLLKENTANAHWTLQSSSTGTVSVTFKRNTDGVLHVMYTSPVLKGKIYATSKTWLAP